MNEGDILKKSESILRAKKIYIESMKFERKSVVSGTVHLKNSNISKIIKEIDKDTYKCSLVFCMSDEEEKTFLDITVSGDFLFNTDLDLELKEILVAKNTLAILFPYLRSQVTLLTAQPDVETVVLPPININALIQNMGN